MEISKIVNLHFRLVTKLRASLLSATRQMSIFLIGNLFTLNILLKAEKKLSNMGRKSNTILCAIQARLPQDPLAVSDGHGGGGQMAHESLRVVIPAHSKDIKCLALTCAGVLRNARPRPSEVLIVTNDVAKCESQIAELGSSDRASVRVIAEEDVILRSGISGLLDGFDKGRSGWVLQQAIKFQTASESEIPVLVLDSDTVLIAPRTFLKAGKVLLMVGTDNHKPYFEHIRGYFDAQTKMEPLSFVTHHQLMIPSVLQDMFVRFGGLYRWLKLGLEKEGSASPVSEYQTYGSFTFKYQRDNLMLGSWSNRNALEKEYQLLAIPPYLALDQLEKKSGRNFFSVSFHSYLKPAGL